MRETRTRSLPKFLPLSRPMNVCGAFSSPSTMSSRYLMRPSLDPAGHVAQEIVLQSGEVPDDEAADGEPLGQHWRGSTCGTRFGPAGNSVALYCAISPHTGTRAKKLSSGSTASNTAPPTFSK